MRVMSDKRIKKQEILFFKLGGKWDSVQINEKIKGKFILNKELLAEIEQKYDLYSLSNYAEKELKFTKHIHSYMEEIYENQKDSSPYLTKVGDTDEWVKVKFISLFDGESAHFTAPFVSCVVSFILKQAWNNPEKAILGDHGTDTADVAILPLLDVYTFDTNLPPIIFTGSNRTSLNFSTSVNDNLFYDLLRLTDSNLNPGAYWVFVRYLFSASDFVKVYPHTSRVIDDFSTFYAPHLTARKLDEVFADKRPAFFLGSAASYKNHISKQVTYDNLYATMKKVIIIDLGTQRQMVEYMEDILNPEYKAVVIAGHSLGNVPNVIKHAAVEAAKQGKLIFMVSRCLIGETQNVGVTYLLNAPQLRSTGKVFINGYKLNKNVAKSLAIRALQENLSQHKTQELVDKFVISRGLSEHNMITL